MRKPLQTALLTAFFLLLGVSTAPAQTFDLLAEQTDLQPDGGEADAHCIVQASNDLLVFFNSAEGGIYAWDDANGTLIEHTSPSDLNNNIPAGGDIDRCDAVTIDENDNVYFSFRSTADNVNYLYRTDVADASTFSTTEVNGINGLETDGSTLYLAGVSDFGATRNGVFEINADLSGDTTAVAANENVDLRGASIEISSSGVLYSWSTGSGSFENVIVSVDPSESPPSFSSFVDPYRSGSPLTDTGSRIDDLDIITFQPNGREFIVVYNGSFDGSSGEEWGRIEISDQSIELLFTEDGIVNNTSTDEYTGGFTEPMAVNSDGEVFATSQDDFGASDYIVQGVNTSALPVEFAGFDAVRNGSTVELIWQTASETNNAGFRVQHQAPTSEAWAGLEFVESRVPGGTTNDPQSYRFGIEKELGPGTHRFRLEQVDLDGSTSLSDPVRVELTGEENVTVEGPNPVSRGGARPEVTVNVSTEQPVDIELYDVLGRKVQTIYSGPVTSSERLHQPVDVSGLSSGTYLLRVSGQSVSEVQKISVLQ